MKKDLFFNPCAFGSLDLINMLNKAGTLSLIGPVKTFSEGNCKITVYALADAEEYGGECYIDVDDATGAIIRISVPGINCPEDYKP